MRVLQFSGDIELEFGADSNPSVSKFDGVLTRHFLYVLGQKRLKGRIKLFLNVLDHNWVSRGETDLNDLEELRVTEFSDHHLVLLLHVFDPLVTLTLRIDEQRPSLGCTADNTVLNGKVISGKSLNTPVSDADGVSENILNLEALIVINLLLLAELHP